MTPPAFYPLCIFIALALTACLGGRDASERMPAEGQPSDEEGDEALEEGPLDEPAAEPLPVDGVPELRAHEKLQFRLADFAQPNEERTIVVELTLKGPRNERPDDFRDVVFSILRRRAPSPYVLKRRDEIATGERPWARINFIYRQIIDRFRKRKKKAKRRGRLKLTSEIVARMPKSHSSNWSGWALKFNAERTVDDLLSMDDEIIGAIERELPTLAVTDQDTNSRFARRMDLRLDLASKPLEPLFQDQLYGLYRGGCAVLATEQGLEVYRLHDPHAPAFEIDPPLDLALRCTDKGAWYGEAETDRAVRVTYKPWAPSERGWKTTVNFSRAVDNGSLRFIASGQTVCLIGENETVGSRHAHIQCMDALSGRKTWDHTASGADLAAVAIRRGVVAFAAGRHIRLLDVATGQSLWHAEVPEATGLTEGSGSCLVDDLFIFPFSLGQLMALDLETQTAPWSITTYGGSNFVYCDAAGNLYLDELGGELLAVNTADMAPKWRFRVADKVLDALGHGEHLFVLMPRALYALESTTGKVAWQLGLSVPATRIYRHHQRLFIASEEAVYELTNNEPL